MWEAFYDHFVDVALVLLYAPISVGDKFYFVYILTFIGLAYVSYRCYEKNSDIQFFKFLFPKKVYLHKSAKIDYGIYLINLFISPLLLVGAGIQTYLSIQVAETLVALNDGNAIITGNWDAATYGCFIIGYTLAADFSVYLIHRFHHQSDVFWPIHALHHSAEVLTPMTLFRKHPLWNLMSHSLAMTFTGLFQGCFVFIFYGVPDVEVLFGINTLYVVYNFFGANLRHSHIWISWGKPLSHLFISPAMHQIHHDPKRMRLNYGEIFAIWDWLFGTLYIPAQKEEFDIGLGNEVQNPHRTLLQAYVEPLIESARQLKTKVSSFASRDS